MPTRRRSARRFTRARATAILTSPIPPRTTGASTSSQRPTAFSRRPRQDSSMTGTAIGDARERAPRGDDLHLRIELRFADAKRGTRRMVLYEAPTACDVCGGSGMIGEPDPDCPECDRTGRLLEAHLHVARLMRIETCPTCGVEPCDECEGTGLVEAERRVRVRIPPGVEDGSQLRVSGEGGDGGPGGVPGDLLIDIAVQPAPPATDFVRYLALAGMLAAVALLVAYLLFS